MSWTDTELFEALGRYEQVCIAATMKPNAGNSFRDYAERFSNSVRLISIRPSRAAMTSRSRSPRQVGSLLKRPTCSIS